MATLAVLFLVAFVFALKQSNRSTLVPPDLSSVGRAAHSSKTGHLKPVKLVILDQTNAEASSLMTAFQEAVRPYAPFPLPLTYVDVSRTPSVRQDLRLQNLPALMLFNALNQEVLRREQLMTPEEIQALCKDLGILPAARPVEEDHSSNTPLPLSF